MALLTDRKFIHFNRKSDFEAQLNANAISDKQIVFLKDAQEIWTHGTYYGSVEQFLDETNKDSTNAVSVAAVYKALADDEKVIAAALNDLNDKYTNLDSSKQDVISDLDTIRENAQSGASKVSNVQADWNAESGLAQILHKPDLSVYENKVTSVNGQTGDVEVVVPQSLLLKGITPRGHTLADTADSYYANELNNGEAGAWFISYSNGDILVKSNDTSKDQDGRVCLSSSWKSRLNYGGMTWANVGDILLVYKQSSLIVVYKVMSINEAGETRIGLMSPNDKIQVNKISNIEGNVNNLLGKIDKRLPYSTDSTNIGNAGNGAYTNVTAGRTNWLDTSTAGAAIKLGNLQIAIDNSGRLYSRNQTNNIWNVTNQLKTITETDLNNVFEPSVIGYATVTNGPSETGSYTVYTFTSSDYDGNGFRSILQIAINRNSGNQYMRTCFKKVDGSGTDFTSTDWKLVSPSVTSVNGQTGEVTITETQLSKGTTTGAGNAVTDINVSNHQITLVKGATYATQSDIDTSIANLVDSAPATLDTLNELAAALGDDPNFATTVANQIGQKYTKPSTGIPASDLAAGVIPAAPGTLNTNNTTAQTVSSSEALSGTIKLHKISKTGSYSDLIKPSTGIPKTDLASAVQTSLEKADTSVQNKGSESNIVAGVGNNSNISITSSNIGMETENSAILIGNDITLNTSGVVYYNGSRVATATDLQGKQDVIRDLQTIRDGAADGTTAIQGVKVNGTALTPDTNKTVNVSVPTKTSDITNDSKFIQDKGGSNLNSATSVIDGAFSNEDIVLTCSNHNSAINVNPVGVDIIANWNGSSNNVNNNGTGNVNINTSQGKAYYNSKEIATVDQIPSAVTESTVSGWGFTKNTGTYSKPSGGIPKTDLASAVQTSLGKADSAIQGVKVNGTALTPDANKVVDVTVPTNVSDLTNDLNFVRRYHLQGQSVLLLTDSGEWAENSELNTPTIVFKFNQTEDNIQLGEFYPTFMYCKLPKAANSDFYPNTTQGLTSYITINLGEPLGYYNGNNAKPYWRTGWDVVPTVSLAFDNGSGSINTVPGINMTFVGVQDRGAIGQGTHYIAICYNSIYRNYNFKLLIFYDLELQRLRSTNPFVLTISDLGEVNTIETIKVNNTTLTPDSNKVVNITIPEGELSNNYEPSSSDNEDLELAAGDTYEEAFGKLEKSINDNEQITAAALTDLDSRINTLHLPQSLDDIPDGSTRKLSDYATTTQLATKQDALVSGTNIKTINNESLLGSGNITIQGGSGGDTNVIETVKVNGTALTPDTNKAVNITSIPASIVTQDVTHRFVSDTEKTTWNGKQNALQYYGESDGEAHIYIYDEHNSGSITLANLDVESAQPITQLSLEPGNTATLETNFSGGTDPYGGHAHIKCYSEGIELKCTIDNENNDTVHLGPSTFTYNNKQIATVDQIPSAVTESTVSGWGFTKNAGTITGITMNGASKGTSGVVDLGTVITSETALSKGTTTGNGNAVTDISVNGHQITLTKGTTFLTSHQGIKTLKTDNTTAQSTSSSEAIAGSGTINLHKVAKTGTYSDLIGKPTIPTVNNATLTIQKNGTTVNTFTANASSNVTANIQVNELPTVSSSDNGKILMVVNGAWALVTPTSIYSGTSEPDSNTGNNGDLYLQTS